MLFTTSESSYFRSLSIRANDNNYNQEAEGGGNGGGGSGAAGRKVKNPSKAEKSKISAKCKKPAKVKKPNRDFAKTQANDTSGIDFLTSEARAAFIRLLKVFTEAPILHHFDREYNIRIDTDASGYAIGGVHSQLTSDLSDSDHMTSENSNPDPKFFKSELGQWHPVAFFSRKMIPTETQSETHNQELLAIVEAFKTWRHYLKGCKYEVLVPTDQINLWGFMNTKSFSPKQFRWAKKLFRYHFRINYRQRKANGAADALFRFSQRSTDEKATLKAENYQILHRLQTSQTKASIAELSFFSLKARPKNSLFSPHQLLIYGTHVRPWLCQLWDELRGELASEGPHKISIGGKQFRLTKLQADNSKAKDIRSKNDLVEGWDDVDGVLHHQGLLYDPEIIQTELISRHHNDPLARHFGIEKTWELVTRKYHWPTLRHDVETYVKGCDVCLASKAMQHKPYRDLQSLLVHTYRWKNLSTDFVTGLPISTNWKSESYNSILVIVDRLTKMVHYEPVKVTIDAFGFAEVIIDMVVPLHGLPDSIVSDRGSVFTWSLDHHFVTFSESTEAS